MFKSIVEILKLAFEFAKNMCSIILSLIAIVFTLLKSLRHYCSGFYIRHQGKKEIEKLKQAIELAERKQRLDTRLDKKSPPKCGN
ncbi:TPA: hypothetical protein RQL06_000829 [Vibrio vulnificus]|nr:hypothetical protein [Vibrio vulnificus]HDZ3273189.1 hypothetical protein [Vibrio vulnificus]